MPRLLRARGGGILGGVSAEQQGRRPHESLGSSLLAVKRHRVSARGRQAGQEGDRKGQRWCTLSFIRNTNALLRLLFPHHFEHTQTPGQQDK